MIGRNRPRISPKASARPIRIRKQKLKLFRNYQRLDARDLNKIVDQINKLNGYGARNEKI